jgi:hypothetical protein
MLFKLCHKIQKEGMQLNLLYDISITVTPKSGKDASKKKKKRKL